MRRRYGIKSASYPFLKPRGEIVVYQRGYPSAYGLNGNHEDEKHHYGEYREGEPFVGHYFVYFVGKRQAVVFLGLFSFALFFVRVVCRLPREDVYKRQLIDLTKFTSGIQIANGTNIVMTDVAGNVAKLGYISMGSLNDTVKAVKYNGVEPTVENVKNGTYKLARPFLIVTKSGAELSQAAKDFIDFILSEAGQKIVAEEGYVAM